MPDLDKVIAEKASELMEIDGVIGVGQGMAGPNEPGIVVMVTHHSTQIEKAVSSQLAGHPFRIHVTGELRAQ
jgi:hypothetical protein